MKTLTRKDIYTPITALFIIAKTCKQPKYPSMDRWIKKLCVCVRRCVRTHTHTHTHTHGILLRNKKEINICDTIDGPKNVTFIDFLWHDITSYYFLSFFSFDLFLLQYKLVQRMLEQGSNPGCPLIVTIISEPESTSLLGCDLVIE